MGAILIPFALFLCVGLVSIVGASVREGQLEPGNRPDHPHLRRARTVMIVTAILVVAILYLGNLWWDADAAWYQRIVFKPIQLEPSVTASRLMLRMKDPGCLNRRIDDLIPDHNHLMHLYVIRTPEMDAVFHLHPDLVEPGVFALDLPTLPAGSYSLYGDIVHQNGLPETLTAQIDLPPTAGKPLTGD